MVRGAATLPPVEVRRDQANQFDIRDVRAMVCFCAS